MIKWKSNIVNYLMKLRQKKIGFDEITTLINSKFQTNFSIKAVETKYYQIKKSRKHFPKLKTYSDILKIYDDRVLIVSDIHSPFVDENMFEKAIKMAKKFNIKTFVSSGDFLDNYVYSFWGTKDKNITWEKKLNVPSY